MNAWEIAPFASLQPPQPSDPRRVQEWRDDLQERGLIQHAITVERGTGRILHGHHRAAAVRALGYEKVPVRLVEADPGEPAAFTEPDCCVPLDQLKTRVFTVGVFDLFHLGHANLLKAAKRMGHYLIVGVQYHAERYKDARLCYTFEQRLDMIRSLRYVDLAVPYERVDEKIRELDFDIFAKGPDQEHAGFQRAVQFCAERGRRVAIIPRTENISASALRRGLAPGDSPAGEGARAA
jgi:cytidyltransferase-like protein